ncbi:hypothetical protein PENTCL1PPCAC_5429, partial [Pristionchus entomophagus]
RSLMGQSNVKLDFTEIEKQRQTQFESKLAAADLVYARDLALEISRHRKQLRKEIFAASTVITILFVSGLIYRRRDVLIPICPLIFGAGYRYESYYGSANHGVLDTNKENAERLLKEFPQLFARPGGPITVAEIDRLRSQMYGSA